METYIRKELGNTWPYWHIATLKKLERYGDDFIFIYDVDNDDIIPLEDAKKLVESDKAKYNLNLDHKLVGKRTTLSGIFLPIGKNRYPIVPPEVSDAINTNNKNDKVISKLKEISDGIIKSLESQTKYTSDVNVIMNGLRGIQPGKCFNLHTKNVVNRTGPSIIFNDNDQIPLCLPNTYENADEIFKDIETKLKDVITVTAKTEILSDKDVDKLNIKRGIPPEFNPDVKRTYTFNIPPDVDISETLRKYSSHLTNM